MSMRWDVNLDLGRVRRAPEQVQDEALAQAMEHIRQVAVSLTPVETGRLAGSAAVHVEGNEASISFEGPYARYQHERLDLHHEHGQAKYLEQPMRTEKDKALGIITQRVRRDL